VVNKKRGKVEMSKNKYSIHVNWTEDDKEFVATCPEFPLVSFLHKNKIKAVKGVESVIKEIMESAEDPTDDFITHKLPKPLIIRKGETTPNNTSKKKSSQTHKNNRRYLNALKNW